jgi:alkylhydroperoxidase family enzyme
VSLSVSCPFCIDLNGQGHARDGVTEEELRSLAQGTWREAPTLSAAEKAVLEYAACLTATPVRIPESTVEAVTARFSPRAFAVLAATVAQVNLWARLIQGLGVNEAGFSETIRWVDLDHYRTRVL